MIGFLRGKFLFEGTGLLYVDCQGVGYEVRIPLSTYDQLSGQAEGTVFTIYQPRENEALLYGFASRPERELFSLLLSVSGVGGSTALALLSSLTPDALRQAIVNQDVGALKRVKGVGQRTAERLLLELKDKLAGGFAAGGTGHAPSSAREEALQALQTLGLPRSQMEKRVDELLRAAPAARAEELIRQALKG